MNKLHIIIIIVLTCIQSVLFAQLTIHVTSIPIKTPPDTSIFVVGSFNDWKFNDSAALLKPQGDGSYALTVYPQKTLSFEYKFNRGNFKTWEGNEDGTAAQNRNLAYDGKPITVNDHINGWENTVSNSTADYNVRILSYDFFMPQLNRTRRIWVYVPPSYETDTTKRFPVLYMQHGQRLFDRGDTDSEEWKIDETLNALFAKGDKGCIVVGIDAQSHDSTSEYQSWLINNSVSEGKLYANFIVNTLKPHIDAHFRTKKERVHTAVGGSMLAGSMSLYMAAEYQNVFSKALIFSPLFDVDSCFTHIQQRGKQKLMRYYFLSGTDEDATKTAAIAKMAATLKEIGYGYDEVKIVKKIDGEPTEWFWAREFDNAYKWLFRDMVASAEEGIFDKSVKVYANDAATVLTVESSESLINSNIQIFDTRQKLLFTGALDAKNIVDINFLQSGNYIIHGVRGDDVLFVKNFVKK